MTFQGFLPCPKLEEFTLVPNEFFDRVLANIDTVAELKIVLVIFRKTYGLTTESQGTFTRAEKISYSQLRGMTHLSDSAISDGLKRALEHGYIEKVKEGSFTTGSSTYGIKQAGVKKDGPELAEPIKPPKPTSKEEVINELLGNNVVEEKPKRTRKRKNYKDKALSEWNCNDVLGYFGARYKEFIGIPYPMFSGKDRKQAKTLLEDSSLSTLDIVKSINYYLKNYKTIKSVPEGYPSWNVFYGWRNTLIPMALVKGAEKTGVREYSGGGEWIPNSWGDGT